MQLTVQLAIPHNWKQILELLNTLVTNNSDSILLRSPYSMRDCYIAVPQFVFDMLRRNVDAKELRGSWNYNREKGDVVFRGIEVLVGYECALIFYHKDYAETKNPLLFHRIDFEVESQQTIRPYL